MALSALAARQVQVVGSYAELAVGVDTTSGTSATITVPTFVTVLGVICGGNTSTTAPYCATVSANTFTITKASSDVVSWMAFGVPRI